MPPLSREMASFQLCFSSYPSINIFFLFLFSSWPVNKLRPLFNNICLYGIHKDFNLLPATRQTPVTGEASLTIVLEIRKLFFLTIYFFRAHSCLDNPTERSFLHSYFLFSFALDD